MINNTLNIQSIHFSVFDNFDSGIIIYDSSGLVLYTNIIASSLLEIGPLTEKQINLKDILKTPEIFDSLVNRPEETLELRMQNDKILKAHIKISKTDNSKYFILSIKAFGAQYCNENNNGEINLKDESHSSLLTKSIADKFELLNDMFINFSSDVEENLNIILATTGRLLSPLFIELISVRDKKILHTTGWNLPEEFAVDSLVKGTIFYDDLMSDTDDTIKIIGNLHYSDYAETDPLVKKYSLKTYVGQTVTIDNSAKSSICLVFNTNYEPTNEDKKILSVLSGAVKVELSRKNATEVLRTSEARLRESSASKDKFFNIIAHDLKNPFHSILGLSDILMNNYESLPTEKRIKFVNNIYSVSKDTYKLLESLLEWARAQTGKLEYNPKYFDLSEIIVEISNLFHSNALQKEISIISNVNSNEQVFADYQMIYTVIKNIISNAIKFSYPKGIITITFNKQDDTGIFEFKDTGTGIAEENIKKLFKIDEQYKCDGTASEKGTGLGLLICKELVEKNGGKIWVESRLGFGSSFYFSLPVKSKSIN